MNATDGIDACAALCELAGRLAVGADQARPFLITFAHESAGIAPGPFWFVSAATGGRNLLPGRGFRPELDDGSRGQARHFGGIVASVAHLGPRATRSLSVHVRRDAPHSADGRLTDEAIEFATLVLAGELLPANASAWLARRLCGS
ncbi:hypothetical protein [Subtercola lobariae]|uniref:Uncharacterized protein n=1 Tax=Subtercola lobariae TaxID=1588641 RepID=A0A917EUT4_9MICO|nr:hypothetical protein [Subtercola lobariae]GGF17484.1 hypothetical protein GCM10011399_09010 [Subtercola lobariae]